MFLGLSADALVALTVALTLVYIISAIIGINFGRRELARDLEFYRDPKDVGTGFYLTTFIYSIIPVVNTIMLIFYGLFELQKCDISLNFIMKLFNIKEDKQSG